MASPRKVVSRTNTTTSSAANFFQRGKKATTTTRVIANKNSTVRSVTPSQADKPASTTQDKDQDDNQGSDDDRHVDDSWGEIDKDVLRELFLETALRSPKKELHRPVSSSSSSSSISKRSQEDHLAMKPLARLFSVVTTPPATPRKQSRARGITQTGVHQGDLSKEEKTLRQFDLASMYGPSLDLTRLERWERAFSLGLDPPQNIKHLLLEHTTLNTSLFTGRV
ncbi:hypothetical protein BGZ68_004703 [Mortierella alpina]|nr:hypothetical protein BGZ68_004703 [Mortierella alpina]